MKKQFVRFSTFIAIIGLFFIWGCKDKKNPTTPKRDKSENTATKQVKAPKAPKKAKLIGVDVEKKIVTIGMLNDESGPGKAIGKPYAVGKRILAAQINEGKSGLLPEGWKIKLIENDHGYKPTKAVQSYNEQKDKVLFIGTSFGTPNTLPLIPRFKRDQMIAFPASLSSKMAESENTPPLGTSYKIEAMRAVEFAIKKARKASRVRMAIVYQRDDYGKDGLEGIREAAKHFNVKIVAEQTIAPTDRKFSAVIVALKKAKANFVYLATLPSATPKIVGTGMAMRYKTTWIGSTPSWVDVFFQLKKVSRIMKKRFYLLNSLPYWGEKLPGMEKFLAAYKKHGKKLHRPDFYILLSYIQGLVQIEALNRMILSKDYTRAGYKTALQSIKNWNGGGLLKGITLTKVPYVTSTQVRVLRPNMKTKSWKVALGYGTPASYKEPVEEAKGDEGKEEKEEDKPKAKKKKKAEVKKVIKAVKKRIVRRKKRKKRKKGTK